MRVAVARSELEGCLRASAQFESFCREPSVKLGPVIRKVSVKIRKRKRTTKTSKMALDSNSEKRGRGRPRKGRRSEIRGRADNDRFIFGQVWDRLWPKLSQAQTDQEVINAFVKEAQPYAPQFMPGLANLVFRIIHEPKFPRRREAQINFLADSLAGLGYVTPRRSRDICLEERMKEKRAHHILRYEYYIECSCGFQGNSRDHACPKCGAKINFGFSINNF